MLFLSKQQLALLLLHFLGNAVHPSTANLFDILNPACKSCRSFGTLLYYTDTVTKKCVETCVLLGRLYQSPTLKCGKCPPVPPPPPPPPPPDTSFSIQLAFDAAFDTKYQPALTQAKAKWEGIITGDLTNANITAADLPKTACTLRTGQIIDDLLICVKTGTVDNAGGLVAQYRVDLVRADGPNKELPAVSQIIIDSADIDTLFTQNRLYAWMLNYMGNALGYGDRWAAKGLAAPVKPCSYSYGAAASREFRTLSGCTIAVPLEQGGTGEDCEAWSGSCLVSEMMSTSTVAPASGGTEPISRISVASMEDLGYKVNYANADPYPMPNGKALCCPARRLGEDTNGADTSSSAKTKPMSEEARAKAIAYGQQILAEAAAVQKQDGTAPTDLTYVGAEKIGLIWEDEGEYYKVIVTKPN